MHPYQPLVGKILPSMLCINNLPQMVHIDSVMFYKDVPLMSATFYGGEKSGEQIYLNITDVICW